MERRTPRPRNTSIERQGRRGEECEAKDKGDPDASLRPLGATKEDNCGHNGAEDRKGERMCDGAMAEGRGLGNVEWPTEHIDIWQRRTCGSDYAHTSRGDSALGPGSDRKANGGM